MELAEIQRGLEERNLAGWLFYDFRRSNSIAYRILGLSDELIATRRWYCFVPRQGQPVAVVSALEPHNLDSVTDQTIVYRTWGERREALRRVLPAAGRVAMEYSPLNAVPYVALVDAGTVELVRSIGVDVVSSADLVQVLMSRWSEAQWRDHREASERLMRIKDRAFAEIARRLRGSIRTTDYEIQEFMLECYADSELVSDHPPIVSTNEHCSNPHYGPTAEHQTVICEGDVVLIDFWARLDRRHAVYADHTWMAFAGEKVPSKVEQVFAAVAAARDQAIDFVRSSFARKQQIHGWQVDDVARRSIERAGYGDYFIHRTGHSIDEAVHGEGANIDNYETHDERVILERTCFSIEPGIYLPDFGVRSEVDVYVAEGGGVTVTGAPVQTAVVPLLGASAG